MWKQSGGFKNNLLNKGSDIFQNLSSVLRCRNVCWRRDVHRCEWRSVYWFHQYNRHYSLHMKTCSPRLKSGVGLGPRILSLRVYDRESFTSFHLQAGNACYIGETNRHFATRIHEHLASDKHSHIFKHLRGSLCSEDCFKILDSASTRLQLKIKEAMHILWEQSSLNSQVKHFNLSLSY